jgi:hypothetical protein
VVDEGQIPLVGVGVRSDASALSFVEGIDDLPFATSHQPLGFAVHTLVDGRLVSHVQALEQLPE